MLLKDFINRSRKELSVLYGEREAASVVSLVCREMCGYGDWLHVVEPDTEIAPENLSRLEAAMRRLKSGEPVQYVLGYAWFMGERYKVDANVLIPRPETELLCRIVCEKVAGRRMSGRLKILDLCTGSGCIAWTLASAFNDAVVYAADLSLPALAVAESQDICRNRPYFLQADVLDFDRSVAGKRNFPEHFDIIVSNPPYVAESEKKDMRANVLDYEPHMALFVEDADPLVFYRAIADVASVHLSSGGFGIVEINERFGKDTASVFSSRNLDSVSVCKDLSDRDRFVFFSKNV